MSSQGEITSVQTSLAQHRITRLASLPAVHRAFGWLHLHQPQLRLWQLEMVAIPAPTFAEGARAEWFLERFRALGLTNVHLDEVGNVLGEWSAGIPGDSQFVLVSAHLDTVFPAGTNTQPSEDGTRMLGPGVCDNGAGLTAMLGVLAALKFAEIALPMTILFAANVGEEGEGDLRGMRYLFEQGAYKGRIAAAVAMEGSGTAAVVTRGLGSRRFRVTITGPGGHSWSDAGAPNPITLLSRGLAALADLSTLQAGGAGPRTTLSPGQISGGTSINSIPYSATVDLDLRSTEPEQLDLHTLEIHRTFEEIVAYSNRTPSGAGLQIESIGNRPAAGLPDDSPMWHTIRAVDRHLGLRTEPRLGSTDANLPLALGIPAVALAGGGVGGGIHTLAEWYDPTGRETALRRALLIVLDLAQTMGTLP